MKTKVKKTKVTVTQEDIEHGSSRGWDTCPVALALKKLGYKDIRVGTRSYSMLGEFCYDRVFSKRLKAFVKAFDTGKSVKPFSFFFDHDGYAE